MAFIAETLYLLTEAALEEFHKGGASNECEQKLIMFSHASQKVVEESGFPGSIETDTLSAYIVSKVKKAKFLVLKPLAKAPV